MLFRSSFYSDLEVITLNDLPYTIDSGNMYTSQDLLVKSGVSLTNVTMVNRYYDNTTGTTGIFIFGGAATVTKISESAGTSNFVVNSSSPTGQQTCLYFSGSTLYIKPAQTTYYRIWTLRTRTSL
mgnify:CR=1 FL=1